MRSQSRRGPTESITIPVSRRFSPSGKGRGHPAVPRVALFRCVLRTDRDTASSRGPHLPRRGKRPSTSEFPWGYWQARTFMLGG
jgi:hypothetical protein